MTMEADFVTTVQPLCPGVFPDVAPLSTPKPYVTYQGFGGQSLRYVDGSAADKRNTYLQVNVWDATRAGALALMGAIEDALCVTPLFIAKPDNEPTWTHDTDVKLPDAPQGLYGCRQDFTIWAPRT